MYTVISRKEAKLKGLSKFFTGIPCKHDHVSYRYTSDKSCVECKKDPQHGARRLLANETKRRSKQEKFLSNLDESIRCRVVSRQEAIKLGKPTYFTGRECRNGHIADKTVLDCICVECRKDIHKRYRASLTTSERAAVALKKREWFEANPEKRMAANARLISKYPGYFSAATSKRSAARLRRTPIWCDLQAVSDIYDECKRLRAATGELYEVDHIVPLQGKLVSGLHVPWNLRIITKSENCRKSAKFDPDVYVHETPPKIQSTEHPQDAN